MTRLEQHAWFNVLIILLAFGGIGLWPLIGPYAMWSLALLGLAIP